MGIITKNTIGIAEEDEEVYDDSETFPNIAAIENSDDLEQTSTEEHDTTVKEDLN